jgi:hypothetical protein
LAQKPRRGIAELAVRRGTEVMIKRRKFMKIANNILKHSLQNVYFLVGTACGGKTTMSKALSAKYGFAVFNDNWHEDNFEVWRSIIDPKYNPISAVRKEVTDWEAWFGRSVEEFLAEKIAGTEGDEYFEFALIELIKMSRDQKVIADLSPPLDLIAELSDHSRIAALLAPAELTIRDYYRREDHREFIECIMSLSNPEKKLATQNELFRIGADEIYADVKRLGFYSIERSENSTVEGTMGLLEKHFGFTN